MIDPFETPKMDGTLEDRVKLLEERLQEVTELAEVLSLAVLKMAKLGDKYERPIFPAGPGC